MLHVNNLHVGRLSTKIKSMFSNIIQSQFILWGDVRPPARHVTPRAHLRHARQCAPGAQAGDHALHTRILLSLLQQLDQTTNLKLLGGACSITPDSVKFRGAMQVCIKQW